MIQETTVTLRKQTPTAPNEWLYEQTFETRSREVTHDDGTTETITEEVEVRTFHPSVYLGKDAAPLQECTAADKAKWDSTHQHDTAGLEPEQPTPADKK